MNLDFKIEFCSVCTTPNTRPNSCVEFKNNNIKEYISFKNGICDACMYYKNKKSYIDWDKRKEQLNNLIKKNKSDNDYDIIVPSSGGKDSTMQCHILKNYHKAKVISYTWAPHIYSTPGFRNLQNMIHNTGVDNILFTPNGKVHRLLTRLAFKNLLHPFQPFILGQKNCGIKFAIDNKIKIFFYGENEAEYGNKSEDNDGPFRDLKFCLIDDDEDYNELLLSGIKVKDILKKYNLEISDLKPYLPIKKSELKDHEIKIYYLGYYYNWDPQNMYYKAVKECNFKPNDHRTEGSYPKYSSFDDRTDGFHYWTTWIKFGIGRCTEDSSQEIRNGKITREEGLKLVEKYDGDLPLKFLPEFLNYIDMDLDEFFETVDKFRNPLLWEKIGDHQWKLKHTCFGKEKIDNSYFIAKKYLEEENFITPLTKYEKLNF